VLGFAHGHVNSYCTRWRQEPELGVCPIAGWDDDADRLAKAAQNHSIAPCTTPAELLARSDVEAVVIAAKTSQHVDLVEQAAAAGKTIILQKPMALTLAEADRIVAAVDAAGVRFTMAWQMRVDAQNLKMKELVDSGTLGPVYLARRRHGLGVCLSDAFADSWHVDPAANRDIWADDAAHAIDFVYWMFGEPESVTAEMVSLRHPRMPMDNGVALFRYADGPLVEVCCSFVNAASENTTEIVGEKGVVVQNYGDAPSCGAPRPEGAPGLKWLLRQDKEWTFCETPTPPRHGDRIAGLSGPLAEFLNGSRGPLATVEEGRTVLRMVLACYVSTREGRRVALADPAIADV